MPRWRSSDCEADMRLIIHGAGGKMGRAVLALAEKNGYDVAAKVSMEFSTDAENGVFNSIDEFDGRADCIIDFSSHLATEKLCSYAVKNGIPVVIATTGQTPEELEIIAETAKKIPVLRSGNMSLGIALLSKLSALAAKAFPDADVEIVETHHNQKKDVPSGTALMLAESVKSVKTDAVYNIGRHENGQRKKEEIGIHSLRAGAEVGTHEVIFATQSQVVTLKHQAQSRELFAEGALSAAGFLTRTGPGLYTMDDIFG